MSDDTVASLVLELTAKVDSVQAALTGVTSQLRDVSDEANKTEAEVESGFASMGKAVAGARETVLRFTESILEAMAIRFSVNGVVDFARDALEAGNQVVELSDRLGISTTQVQQLGYVATQSGTNIGALSGVLINMNRVLGEGATGNVTAARAFTQLHLSVQQLLAEDPADRFMTVASAINVLGSDAEKSKASADIFGRGYKDLGNIMHLSAGQMKEMMDQAVRNGDVASPETLDRIHRLALEYDDLKQRASVLTQEGFVGLYNNANLVEGALAVLTGFIGSKMVPSLVASAGASIAAAVASAQQAAALVAETEAMNAAAASTGNLTRMEIALAAAEQAAAGAIAENTIFVGASGEAAIAATGGMATFAAGARGAGAALLGAFGGPIGLAITATLTALALHTNQATSAQKIYNEQIADFSSKAAEMSTANAKRRQEIENDSNAIIAADVRELESLDTLINAYAAADKHTGFGSSILNGLGELGLAGKEVAGKMGLGQAPREVMAQADELEKAIAKLKAILATPLAPKSDNSLEQYNDKVAKAAARFDQTLQEMEASAETAFSKAISDDPISDALNEVNLQVNKAAEAYKTATGQVKQYSQAELDSINNTRLLAQGTAAWGEIQTAINNTRTPLEAYNEDMTKLVAALTFLQQHSGDVAVSLGIDPAKMQEATTAVQRQLDLMTDGLNKYKDLFTSISSEIPGDFDKMFEDLESSSTRNWKSITDIFLDTFKELLAKMATLALAEPIIVPMVETLGTSLGISQTGITAELAKMGITGASNGFNAPGEFSLASLLGTSALGSGSIASTVDSLGSKYLGIGSAATFDDGSGVAQALTDADGNAITNGGVSSMANFGNAFGGFAGSELGNLAFGKTGTAGTVASIAGGLGGAAAATGAGAIGTAVGGALGSWAGPVGAAVGAFAAEGIVKAVSSLFGGKPSDMTEAGEASLASNTVTSTSGATSGKKFSQANTDERDSLLSFATSLSSTLATSIGTTLDNQLTVKIGNRDGSSYTIWGQAAQSFDSTSDGMKKLAQSVVDLYAASGKGSAEVADLDTAIKKIDFSNVTQAASDLQFAANFESLMTSLTTTAPVVSAVDTEVTNLNTTFDGYRATAERLGLSLDKVNTAYQAQMKILQNDFLSSYQNTALNDLLPGYSDLAAENASYTQSLKDAATLGLNNQQITEITLEHQLSIKSLLAQNNTASKDAISNATTLVSTYSNLSSGFASLLDELQTGDLSTASPTADLDDLRSQVESVGAQAQNGDTDAQSQLLTLLPEFLKQSATVNGYNTDYAADQQMATTLAESAKSVADQQLTVQQGILNAANSQTNLLEQIAGVGTGGNANDKLVAAIKAGYTGLTNDQIDAIYQAAGVTVTPGNGARTNALNANSAANTTLNDVFHALGVQGFATGGSIGMGGGKPGVDSVPILTMPGEFVMRARAVAALGVPTLNYMNSTGQLPSNDNASTADLSARIDRLTDVVYAGFNTGNGHLAGIPHFFHEDGGQHRDILMLAYFIETTALDTASVSHQILLTSGLGYSDPSGPGFYEPRIMGEDDSSTGLSVTRTVFDNGALGAGSLTYGTLTAANPDGGLASWLDWGFSTATLKLGDDAGPYSGLATVLTAPTAQAIATDTAMTLAWTSRMVELALPACPATFAGTNSGTDGLEGTSADIMGQNKPWAIGKLFNIKPVVLNSSTRIVGWNFNTDGTRRATHSVDEVKYGGAQWTLLTSAGTGGDFATSAALIAYLTANNLTTGYYLTCLAESLVAMGGNASLTSVVTVDVTIEANASDRYAATLWQRVLQRAGVPLPSISTSDVAALNAVAPFEAGYYATGSVTFQTIADAMSSSVAACYVPDRLGTYRIRQMVAPAGSPVASFKRLTLDQVQGATDGDLITLTPASSANDWVPVKSLRCTYAHNWTVLSSGDVAAAVATADATALTLEWQYTPYSTSASAAAMYANAIQQDYTTYLAYAADAAAIAAVLLALYSAQRREYQATVTFGTQFGSLVDLGSIVAVTHPKYGWSNTLVAVHGIRLRDNAGLADLKFWL